MEAECAEPSNEVVCSSKQLDVGTMYRFAIGGVCRLGGTPLSKRRAPIGGGGALSGEASPARFRCDEATAGAAAEVLGATDRERLSRALHAQCPGRLRQEGPTPSSTAALRTAFDQATLADS